MRNSIWRSGLMCVAITSALAVPEAVAAQTDEDRAKALAERFAVGGKQDKAKARLPAGARPVVPAPTPAPAEEQRLSEEIDMLARARAEAEARREELLKAREAAERADTDAAGTASAEKAAEQKRAAEARERAEAQLRIAEEKRRAEEAKQAAEARQKADEARRQEELRRAADARRAEEVQREVEARRRAETERLAAEQARRDEERRLAEAREAEAARQAAAAQAKAEEERRIAEARKADEARQAEARRRADEERRLAEERQRAVAAAEAAREAAETRRKADEERIAAEAQHAMEKEREAEAERIAETLRRVREARLPRAADSRDPASPGRDTRNEADEPAREPPATGDERLALSPPSGAGADGSRRTDRQYAARVAVLLVLSPGNYGIRRHNKTADPLLCAEQGCYVSAGADHPAELLHRRKALGIGRTLGQRAGACQNSLGCVFRDIDLGAFPAIVQPVDMHVIKHDRRQPQVLHETSSCTLSGDRLACTSFRGPDYTMWVVPEALAEEAGPQTLARALEDGLPEAEPAAFRPGRRW